MRHQWDQAEYTSLVGQLILNWEYLELVLLWYYVISELKCRQSSRLIQNNRWHLSSAHNSMLALFLLNFLVMILYLQILAHIGRLFLTI
jgi:hypothetical protein